MEDVVFMPDHHNQPFITTDFVQGSWENVMFT